MCFFFSMINYNSAAVVEHKLPLTELIPIDVWSHHAQLHLLDSQFCGS